MEAHVFEDLRSSDPHKGYGADPYEEVTEEELAKAGFDQIKATEVVGMPKDTVDKGFMDRCRAIYQQLLPQLMADHRGEVIAIEPESGDYFLGENLDSASEKAMVQYPDRLFGFFRVDESPAVLKLRYSNFTGWLRPRSVSSGNPGFFGQLRGRY